MKTSSALLPFLFILVFGSCSQDVDPPVVPPVDNLPGEKKVLEIDYRQFGGSENDFSTLTKFLATVNQDDRTITLWTDTAAKKYKRYHYDSQGRLERIVQADPAPTHEGDLKVERPGPDSWKISYSDGAGNSYTDNIVKTTLSSGMQQIVITSAEYPQYRLEEHIDNNNLLIFREVFYIRQNNSGPYKNRRWYNYDGNKRMTSTVDTNFTESSKPTNRQVITVTKDNANNTAITDLLKMMVGTDMQWLLHSGEFDYLLPNLYFDYYLRPYTSLQAGSVTGVKTYSESSADGIIFTPGNITQNFESKYVYDAKGRMTSFRMTKDASLVRGMTLKYFD